MIGQIRPRAERLVSVLIESSFLTLIFLVPLILTPFTQELFEWPKMMLVYIFTLLIIVLWGIKTFLSGRIDLPKTPYFKYLLPFLVFYVLSTIFSVNFFTSLWGYYTRFNGGLLSLLAYLFLLYLFLTEFKTRTKINRFLVTLLFSALLVSIYGILQRLGIDRDFWTQHSWERVFSTLGQPNWLAAFLGTLIPLNLGLFLSRVKKSWGARKKRLGKEKIWVCLLGCAWVLLLLAANVAAFYLTRSRSGYLSLAISLFLGAGILSFRQTLKVRLPLLGLLVIVALAAAIFLRSDLFDLKSETARIRTIVWQGTLRLISDHPFCGTGPETFAYAFLPYRPEELNQTTEWDFVFNKPHNEYLGIAAGSGLPSLFLYLGFIASVSTIALKYLIQQAVGESWFLVWGVWLGLISLWISNFFGFSVVANQLLFFLFPGLIFLTVSNPDRSHVNFELKPKILAIFTLTSLTIAGTLMVFWARFWRAEIFYSRGGGDLDLNIGKAQEQLEKAVRLNPWQPRYRMGLAYTYALKAQNSFDKERGDALNLAEEMASEAYHQNPDDYILRGGLIKVYIRLSLTDEKYFAEALNLAQINTENSPTNPYDHYYLASLYFTKGEIEKAQGELEKAIQLKPDFEKAQTLLNEIRE